MHPGLRREATEFLLDQGVRLIGIDACSRDRPFDVMIAEAKAVDPGQRWESHLLGRHKEYCQIEKLCHLEDLPADRGFTVLALPVTLDRASAGWSRVVTVFEGDPAASDPAEPTADADARVDPGTPRTPPARHLVVEAWKCLAAPAVFKTDVAGYLGQAGSAPVRLRQLPAERGLGGLEWTFAVWYHAPTRYWRPPGRGGRRTARARRGEGRGGLGPAVGQAR